MATRDGEEPPTLGRDWTTRFIASNPSCYKVKQKPLEIDRAVATDPIAINEWYELYHDVVDIHQIQDADQYNFDESGFRIGIGGNQFIITRLEEKSRFQSASETNRDFASCLEAISGNGCVLPRAIILKGEQILHHHITHTDLPDNYVLGVQTAGYSNDDYAFEWIKHFDKYSKARQVGVYRLLLLDGHGSHLTKEFAEYCDENRIILFAIPPHTSHFLQPLDIVLFQPFKHNHRKAVEMATQTGCTDFNKVEFLYHLKSIRNATFKALSIRSA